MDLISRSTLAPDFFLFLVIRHCQCTYMYMRQTANSVVCDTLKNEWSRFTIPIHRSPSSLFYYRCEISFFSCRIFRLFFSTLMLTFSRWWGIKLAMGICAEQWSDDVNSRRFTLDIIIEKKKVAKIRSRLFWRSRQQPRECSLNCHSLLSLIKNVRLFLVASFRELHSRCWRCRWERINFTGFCGKRLETHNFRERNGMINLKFAVMVFVCANDVLRGNSAI